jgi:hypothetical protein
MKLSPIPCSKKLSHKLIIITMAFVIAWVLRMSVFLTLQDSRACKNRMKIVRDLEAIESDVENLKLKIQEELEKREELKR